MICEDNYSGAHQSEVVVQLIRVKGIYGAIKLREKIRKRGYHMEKSLNMNNDWLRTRGKCKAMLYVHS